MWVWINSGSWWWTGRPGVLQSLGSQSRTQLSDWTDWLNWQIYNIKDGKLYIITVGNMGKQWKQCQTLFFGGSRITADGDCSYEIKRRLLLGRKVMTNLDIILKSRDITLPTKVRLVKAMVFPAVMYGCESWTVWKAECWRIDAFELWCWRRLLRVPWTARRSNQSILKEGLGAGGEGDNRGWDGWMASPTRWTWVWVNSGSWWWTGRPGGLRFMGSQRVGHDWATELNWTEDSIPFQKWGSNSWHLKVTISQAPLLLRNWILSYTPLHFCNPVEFV